MLRKSLLIKVCFSFFLLFLANGNLVFAFHGYGMTDNDIYLISFIEGEYKETNSDDNATYQEPYNKYNATVKVILLRNNKCNPDQYITTELSPFCDICSNATWWELDTFKGSTLPSRYIVYPTDGDSDQIKRDMNNGIIQPFFNSVCEKSMSIPKKDGISVFDGIKGFLCMFNYEYPILKSSKYSFHVDDRNRFKPSGHYFPKALEVTNIDPNYYWLPTENENFNHGNQPIIEGVWIHRGRNQSELQKDSAGCLTIAPSDWDRFIDYFPHKSDWQFYKMKGIMQVTRPFENENFNSEQKPTSYYQTDVPGDDVPNPPTGLRIVRPG